MSLCKGVAITELVISIISILSTSIPPCATPGVAYCHAKGVMHKDTATGRARVWSGFERSPPSGFCFNAEGVEELRTFAWHGVSVEALRAVFGSQFSLEVPRLPVLKPLGGRQSLISPEKNVFWFWGQLEDGRSRKTAFLCRFVGQGRADSWRLRVYRRGSIPNLFVNGHCPGSYF